MADKNFSQGWNKFLWNFKRMNLFRIIIKRVNLQVKTMFLNIQTLKYVVKILGSVVKKFKNLLIADLLQKKKRFWGKIKIFKNKILS